MKKKEKRKAHGCLRFLAILVIILFVLLTVPITLVARFAGMLTNRAYIKSAIELDAPVELFMVRAIEADIQQRYAEMGLPPAEIDMRRLYRAVDLAVPPGWIDDAVDSSIDTVYDLLEHGRTDDYTLSYVPLIEQLQSADGLEAMTIITAHYPPCPSVDDFVLVYEERNVAIPCLPPDRSVEETAVQIHSVLVAGLRNDPQNAGGVERLSWPPDILETTVELRQAYQILDQMWQLWLIPLGLLLLIALLAVRSLPGLGLWLGWPLLFSGILTPIAGIAVFFLYTNLQQTLLAEIGPVEGEMSQLLSLLVINTLASLRNIWLGTVLLTAGVMFAVGLVGILFAFFYNRRLRQSG